jgi:Bax protein
LRRNAGSTHEVAKFDSVSDAIKSYLKNINTHRAYADLRNDRASLRSVGEPITGHQLAEGLIDYSELREAYVHEIQAVIRINKLSQYD